jgi:hypothetical protein
LVCGGVDLTLSSPTLVNDDTAELQ